MLFFLSCSDLLDPSRVEVDSVSLEAFTNPLEEGEEVQLQAIVSNNSAGPLQDRQVFWATEDSTIARVSPDGMLRAVRTGQTRVAASSEGVHAILPVSVVIPAVRTLDISPDSLVLPIRTPAQLAVTARDRNNNVLQGRSVTWLSRAPAVATVDASGLVQSVRPGVTYVVATAEQVSDSIRVRVVSGPPAILEVRSPSPQTGSVGDPLPAPLQVAVLDADRNPVIGQAVQWGVVTGGGTIAPPSSVTGNEGIATATWTLGPNVGVQQAQATVGTLSVALGANAIAGSVRRVEIKPDSAVLQAIGATVQLVATGFDQFGNPIPGLPFLWASLNPSVAVVDPSGLVEARGNGIASIVAQSGPLADTVTVRVTVRHSLVVNKAGNGNGTVTSSPAGINCGNTCSAIFDHGITVTLTASPVAGSTFTGWSGEGCSGTGTCNVPMTQARNITATFSLITHTLTVSGGGNGNGTVTSSPAGINCTITNGSASGTCQATFTNGTQVTLTASPAGGGHTFTGWSGACTGTGACSFAMTQARSVTATFAAPVIRTLTVSGGGNGNGTVTSNPGGINCTITSGSASGTCQATFPNGTQVTLTASPTGGSTFTAWSGACTGSGACSFAMTQDRSVTASFAAPIIRTLTVSGGGNGNGTVTSNPGGINCTITSGSASGTCQATFTNGTQVTLTALPAGGGHSFTGWSGEGCSGTGTCAVSMTQNRNVTASFAAPPVPRTLTVNGAGNGNGTVTSNPAGINCTITNGSASGTCQTTFPNGTSVTLTATPTGAGQTFTGWSGGGCSGSNPSCNIVMDQNRTTTAAFALITQTLTVNKTGAGSGTVTSSPAGIDCGTTCSAPFAQGSTVTLTANAAAGSTFTGWSGAGTTNGQGQRVVTMNQAQTVVAAFALASQDLTINGTGTGNGRVTSNTGGIDCRIQNGAKSGTCTANYPNGTAVTLTAVADSAHSFSGWAGDCTGGASVCNLVMNAPRTTTAGFTAPAGNRGSVIRAGTGALASRTGARASATTSSRARP